MKPAIIIVEDDRWLAESYQRELLASFSVTLAGSGENAIDLIDSSQPAALVCDVLLGGSSIMTLLHELQSHDDLRHIPVVLITTARVPLEPESLKAYGIRAVLDKTTLQPGQLRAAVREVMA